MVWTVSTCFTVGGAGLGLRRALLVSTKLNNSSTACWTTGRPVCSCAWGKPPMLRVFSSDRMRLPSSPSNVSIPKKQTPLAIISGAMAATIVSSSAVTSEPTDVPPWATLQSQLSGAGKRREAASILPLTTKMRLSPALTPSRNCTARKPRSRSSSVLSATQSVRVILSLPVLTSLPLTLTMPLPPWPRRGFRTIGWSLANSVISPTDFTRLIGAQNCSQLNR